METRLRVAVVVGIPDNSCILDLLQPLRTRFDISVYAIENADSLNQYRSAIDLKIFPHIRDMPGYMRGVEDALQHCDVIIAVENYSLSSFQAIRASVKFDKPSIIISGGTQVFYYNEYPNIKAIQADINSNAGIFAYNSQAAKQALLADGVDSARLRSLPPVIDHSRMPFNIEKRQKFRQYIGIQESELVLLFCDDLIPENKPFELINVLKILRQKNSVLFPKMKILYAGNGHQAEQLKYHVVDQGLGSKVMFLHQNPQPFFHDLLCASDALALFTTNKQTVGGNPSWILQAASCGVFPLVSSTSVESEWLGSIGHVFSNSGAAEIALALEQYLNRDLVAEKDRVHRNVREFFNTEQTCRILESYISELWLNNQGKRIPAQNIEEQLTVIEHQIASGKDVDLSLIALEDFNLRNQNSPWIKPHVLRLRGEIAYRQNSYDVATEYLAECTSIDPKNGHAYLRLAQIAYTNHANEEALTFYKKVLAIEPNSYEALFGIGLIHRRVGLTDEALYWFSRCVTIDSHNIKGLTALSQTCFEAHHTVAAIELLEKVREAIGDQMSIVLALGQLHIKCGNLEIGQNLLKLVIPDSVKMTGS